MQRLTADLAEYQLLDSGSARKLERFGEFTLIRPEAQAKWGPKLPAERWNEADAEFVRAKGAERGEWKFRKALPKGWELRRGELRFLVRPAPSGHVGVFPDQACHWDWISEVTRRAASRVKVLCLFGHTGLATLAAAAAGAEVTHVDASRSAVEWARENQRLSGLAERPIRWIIEDALSFVKREARRGKYYDALLIDPPRFGRGPDGQIWKLEESLGELLKACGQVLSANPAFVLLNVYVTVLTRGRAEADAEVLARMLKAVLTNPGLAITSGELGVEDTGGHRISSSVFARAVG